MIVPNQYNHYQVEVMNIITPRGEILFEELFQIFRAKYPKFRRFQLAANIWQLVDGKHLEWEYAEKVGNMLKAMGETH